MGRSECGHPPIAAGLSGERLGTQDSQWVVMGRGIKGETPPKWMQLFTT